MSKLRKWKTKTLGMGKKKFFLVLGEKRRPIGLGNISPGMGPGLNIWSRLPCLENTILRKAEQLCNRNMQVAAQKHPVSLNRRHNFFDDNDEVLTMPYTGEADTKVFMISLMILAFFVHFYFN